MLSSTVEPPELRTAVPDDLPAVLDLWTAAGSVPTITDSEVALRTLLAHDPGALLLAERDHALAGTLIVTWDGWRGGFWRLAVAVDHRRRGIGRALVSAGEERLRALRARRISVIVAADAEPAFAFWAGLGYTREHDRARMVKDLGA